jgi:hypothetical protein
MTDAKNVDTGGMGRRISEVADLIDSMTIIHPSATVDFAGKLAAENGWTAEHAGQVYREYRRFLLMAWMSPSMVVPSHDVDQAWHLHLTHTRHYWDVLCGSILMKPLHHDPSLGTDAEAGRHSEHYASTLSLYRYLFDEDAPVSIWPQPCGSCVERSEEAVLASGAGATGLAISAAVGATALLTGHPLVGIVSLAIAAAMLVVTLAQSVTAGDSRRGGRSYGAYRPTRPSTTAAGRTRSDSSSRDTSGSDGALAFLAWSDPGPAAAHSATHGHSHAAADTGHSDGGHGGHSCGGHSCGSSCGGGGCGGGGD